MNLYSLSEFNNKAVKAVMCSHNNLLLLQKRDSEKNIPYPGCWNLFGGLVEEGEKLEDALYRELTEELGGFAGAVKEKIFDWCYQSKSGCSFNYYFAVNIDANLADMTLLEGEDFDWISLERLMSLPSTPALYMNYFKIASFVYKEDEKKIQNLVDKFLYENQMTMKNDRVIYVKCNPVGISMQQIGILYSYASYFQIPIVRLCLHEDDSCNVHEMIIIHTCPKNIGPLKQNKTSLSYHMIEGELAIKIFDDNGKMKSTLNLSANAEKSNTYISCRLKSGEFRSIESKTPYTIFLEVASGPFVDSDTIWYKNRIQN